MNFNFEVYFNYDNKQDIFQALWHLMEFIRILYQHEHWTKKIESDFFIDCLQHTEILQNLSRGRCVIDLQNIIWQKCRIGLMLFLDKGNKEWMVFECMNDGYKYLKLMELLEDLNFDLGLPEGITIFHLLVTMNNANYMTTLVYNTKQNPTISICSNCSKSKDKYDFFHNKSALHIAVERGYDSFTSDFLKYNIDHNNSEEISGILSVAINALEKCNNDIYHKSYQLQIRKARRIIFYLLRNKCVILKSQERNASL